MKKKTFQEIVKPLNAGDRLKIRIRPHQFPILENELAPLSICEFVRANAEFIFVKYLERSDSRTHRVNFARIESIELDSCF